MQTAGGEAQQAAVKPAPMLVIVTGLSGAGRTTAINALEDLGFEAVNNVPLALVERLVRGAEGGAQRIALGVAASTRGFSARALTGLVDRLCERPGVAAFLVFLGCDDAPLLSRFNQTRRRHPLSPERPPSEGIALEAQLLHPVRLRADVLIDTSALSPHDLRAEIVRLFDTAGADRLGVQVQSFSYKRGIPRGVDFVLDCRFLRNPHWDDGLRARDGRDAGVVDYIAADPNFAPFFDRVHALVESLLPAFADTGKPLVSIALGCTGGQHRSVAVAEKLAYALARSGWGVSKRHRELERGARAGAAGPTDG